MSVKQWLKYRFFYPFIFFQVLLLKLHNMHKYRFRYLFTSF